MLPPIRNMYQTADPQRRAEYIALCAKTEARREMLERGIPVELLNTALALDNTARVWVDIVWFREDGSDLEVLRRAKTLFPEPIKELVIAGMVMPVKGWSAGVPLGWDAERKAPRAIYYDKRFWKPIKSFAYLIKL